MPQIRVLLGYQQGQVFSLSNHNVVIGRDVKSDIVLHPDSAASRRHAEILFVEGQWRVKDLGSVNGTVLNGQPVREELLSDKDEVVIGDNVFVFEDKDADSARIAEAASHTNVLDSRCYHNRPDVQALVLAMRDKTEAAKAEITKVTAGKGEVVRDLLTALISFGHVLLSGARGGAGHALLSTLSHAVSLKFVRLPMAAKLTAADLAGKETLAVDETTGQQEYRFQRGPIFSNVILAENINCAAPEAQSVVLNAMNEYLVPAAGQNWPMEDPFFVVATRSSQLEQGARPFAESQLDRFMFNLRLVLPEKNGTTPVTHPGAPTNPIEPIMTHRQILALRATVRDLAVSDHLVKYTVRLVRATRPTDRRAPEFIRTYVHSGAGPRAAHYLILGAKARAVISGRLHATTDDVRSVALPTLRHRIFPNATAATEGIDSDQIVERLIQAVPEPGDENS
jgi:MoxR-like ATPase